MDNSSRDSVQCMRTTTLCDMACALFSSLMITRPTEAFHQTFFRNGILLNSVLRRRILSKNRYFIAIPSESIFSSTHTLQFSRMLCEASHPPTDKVPVYDSMCQWLWVRQVPYDSFREGKKKKRGRKKNARFLPYKWSPPSGAWMPP